MAWKPKLPVVGTEVVSMERRPWVAVAEKNAEACVNLFVNIMKNNKYPVKVRMEAATRIVMIAGATFRGEKRDGNGRPAANLPTGTHIFPRLGEDALRLALRQLPEGTVIESEDEAAEGDTYVVLKDGAHQRKPTGEIAQASVGGIRQGIHPKEEATRLTQQRLDEEQKEREEAASKIPKPPEDAIEMMAQVFSKGRHCG